jgi:bidirectional [NiFe] hydrogenase diaphorase subunit
MKTARIAPPSDDKRWRVIDATMRRHGYHPHALIETLHATQESFGFLDEDALRYIAATLGVALSHAYGVATFYRRFTLKPRGARHTCVVCTGTACHLKGAPALLEALHRRLDNDPTNPPVSIMAARCLASCGLAPAVVFDGKVVGNVTPDLAIERIEKWLKDES